MKVHTQKNWFIWSIFSISFYFFFFSFYNICPPICHIERNWWENIAKCVPTRKSIFDQIFFQTIFFSYVCSTYLLAKCIGFFKSLHQHGCLFKWSVQGRKEADALWARKNHLVPRWQILSNKQHIWSILDIIVYLLHKVFFFVESVFSHANWMKAI